MDEQPLVCLLTLRFHAPFCHSLKDRRSEVTRLLSRLRAKFNVSAVDAGPQGLHARFDLCLAFLAFHNAQKDSMKESILAFVMETTQAQLTDILEELL